MVPGANAPAVVVPEANASAVVDESGRMLEVGERAFRPQEGDVVRLTLDSVDTGGIPEDRSGVASASRVDSSGGIPEGGSGVMSDSHVESGGIPEGRGGVVSVPRLADSRGIPEGGRGVTPPPQIAESSRRMAGASPGRHASEPLGAASSGSNSRDAGVFATCPPNTPIGDWAWLVRLMRAVRALAVGDEYDRCWYCRNAVKPKNPVCALTGGPRAAPVSDTESHPPGNPWDGQPRACARCRLGGYPCDWRGRIPDVRGRREGLFRMEAYLELRLAGKRPNPLMPFTSFGPEELSERLAREYDGARERDHAKTVAEKGSRGRARGSSEAGPSSAGPAQLESSPAAAPLINRAPRGPRGHRAGQGAPPPPVMVPPPPAAIQRVLEIEAPEEAHLAQHRVVMEYAAVVLQAAAAHARRYAAAAFERRVPWSDGHNLCLLRFDAFSSWLAERGPDGWPNPAVPSAPACERPMPPPAPFRPQNVPGPSTGAPRPAPSGSSAPGPSSGGRQQAPPAPGSRASPAVASAKKKAAQQAVASGSRRSTRGSKSRSGRTSREAAQLQLPSPAEEVRRLSSPSSARRRRLDAGEADRLLSAKRRKSALRAANSVASSSRRPLTPEDIPSSSRRSPSPGDDDEEMTGEAPEDETDPMDQDGPSETE